MSPLFLLGLPVIPNLQKLSRDYDMPPTLYSILDAIVNFNNPNPVKIKDLPAAARTTIFDFSYPLSDKINKADFETMILKHYIMRRIGKETVTAFKLALDSKLNEIMPYYNKLFDAEYNWKIFEDGEVTTRNATTTNTDSNSSTSSTSGNTSNTASGTMDHRYSDTPENQIEQIQSGEYVSEYSYDQNTSTTTGTNNTTTNQSGNASGSSTTAETISHTPADKMRNYVEYINNSKKIYSMIFKDLDVLFYQTPNF